MNDAGTIAAPALSRQVRRQMERRERGRMAAVPAKLLCRFLASAADLGGDGAMRSLSPHLRVPMLLALRHFPDVPRDVLQDSLEEVWLGQHMAMVKAFGGEDDLRAFFREAAYPAPDHLPDAFPVYRGSCGVAAEVAARGFSWTTEPDTAAHHAFQKRREGWADPCIVLRAEVPREAVIFSSDDLGSNEVILDGVPSAWEVMDLTMEAMADAADRNLARVQQFVQEVAAGEHGFSPASRRLQDTAIRMLRKGGR